jgi:hypothetical protein
LSSSDDLGNVLRGEQAALCGGSWVRRRGVHCRLQTVADEVEGRLEMDGGAVAEDTVDIIYSWPSGRRRKFADVDGDMVGRACTRAGEARGAAEPDST